MHCGKRKFRSKCKMKIGEELADYLHCMLCAQRRSAPERACIHGGRKKRVFFCYDIKERKYRAQRTEEKPGVTCRPTTNNKFYTWTAQPCDNHFKERFLSFLFLFVCFYLLSALLVLSFLYLLVFFFLSAFFSFRAFFSSFSHPQVCGSRFRDTPWLAGITLIGRTATTTTNTRLDKRNKKEWNPWNVIFLC